MVVPLSRVNSYIRRDDHMREETCDMGASIWISNENLYKIRCYTEGKYLSHGDVFLFSCYDTNTEVFFIGFRYKY